MKTFQVAFSCRPPLKTTLSAMNNLRGNKVSRNIEKEKYIFYPQLDFITLLSNRKNIVF